MRDTATIVDDYLQSGFGVTLERVLGDACSGVATFALGRCVEIVCDPVGLYVYDDDGLSETYEGELTLEGTQYRFRCCVFTDGGGSRFLEALDEFEIVSWAVRMEMPAGGAEAG